MTTPSDLRKHAEPVAMVMVTATPIANDQQIRDLRKHQTTGHHLEGAPTMGKEH